MGIPTTVESIEAMSGLDRKLPHSQFEYVLDGIINIVFCRFELVDSELNKCITETI